MANSKHLILLNQGIAAWNKWRLANPEIVPYFPELDLEQADLFFADLRRANLRRANLRRANLRRANLREADLREANLREADLREADLHGTHLGGTDLANVNLTEAKGLDTCHHYGPSTLDFRTLQRSGLLPLAFLRGCGLPDLAYQQVFDRLLRGLKPTLERKPEAT